MTSESPEARLADALDRRWPGRARRRGAGVNDNPKRRKPCTRRAFLGADDGTRTHDLLHGKCERPSAPVRARSLKPKVYRDFRTSERTRPNPSERRTLPFLPRSRSPTAIEASRPTWWRAYRRSCTAPGGCPSTRADRPPALGARHGPSYPRCMAACRQCGSELTESARFCPACGTARSRVPVPSLP
jgi:zinc-ribbon domain